MTTLQKSQLFKLATIWRKIAGPVGPLHGWWDYIFDAESLLLGEKPMLNEPVEWYIKEGKDGLVKWEYMSAVDADAWLEREIELEFTDRKELCAAQVKAVKSGEIPKTE